jgi:hypothetical protein
VENNKKIKRDIDKKKVFQISIWMDAFFLGMHRISGWSDIRPFLISGIQPDTILPRRICGKAGYRISG